MDGQKPKSNSKSASPRLGPKRKRCYGFCGDINCRLEKLMAKGSKTWKDEWLPFCLDPLILVLWDWGTIVAEALQLKVCLTTINRFGVIVAPASGKVSDKVFW